MYGDADVIRTRAAELREQAADIRSLAERLAAGADAIEWPGRAAEGLRVRMRERAAQLRDVAGRHETAGDTLAKHGTAVAGLVETIGETERRAARLVADARAREAELASYDDAADVTRTLGDDDRRLIAFDPPPAGHKDWLSVSLPGL